MSYRFHTYQIQIKTVKLLTHILLANDIFLKVLRDDYFTSCELCKPVVVDKLSAAA